MVILKADSIPPKQVEAILQILNQMLPAEEGENSMQLLTPKDVTVQMFACGNLNSTYHVEVHQNTSTKYLPNTAFVIKIFNTDSALPVNHHSSAVAQILIGQSGLGPAIYLVTPQAIVMESLVAARARIANLYDDQEPHFRRALASTLARFHSLPVTTERNQALEYLENTLLGGSSKTTASSAWNSKAVLASLTSGWMREVLLKYDCRHLIDVKRFKAEVKWLVELIRREHENLAIVFSHNDLNHSNVLILEAEEDGTSSSEEEEEGGEKVKKIATPADYNIKLVDFDFSRYFYRGADFGRYFLDYTDPAVEDTPTSPDASAISEPVMLEYIEAYRKEFSARLSSDKGSSARASYLNDPANSAQAILGEAKLFMLYCALLNVFQATWAASFRDEENMEGCLIWADMCFGRYQRLKATYFSELKAVQAAKAKISKALKNEPQLQKSLQPPLCHQKLQAKA